MDKRIKDKLESIAKCESMGIWLRGGLKPLHDLEDGREDEEDFVPVSVRELARMLERAYELGKNE